MLVRDFHAVIGNEARQLVVTTITRTFRGYFAGQVVLALILSAGQIAVFTLLKIPYGVLFAVLIGLTTLIPYASAFTIVAVSLLLAVQDPGMGLAILVAAIGVGQIVDQAISPCSAAQAVGSPRRCWALKRRSTTEVIRAECNPLPEISSFGIQQGARSKKVLCSSCDESA